MVVTRTHAELVMVDVFCTNAPIDFLQLFFEAAGGVVETFENSADGRHVVVLGADTLPVVVLVFAFFDGRNRWHKEFVGIGCD